MQWRQGSKLTWSVPVRAVEFGSKKSSSQFPSNYGTLIFSPREV